jgi:hypothetical protein
MHLPHLFGGFYVQQLYTKLILMTVWKYHVNRLFHAGRRALRRERVFRDRTKPLDIYDDFELIDKYRFDRQSISLLTRSHRRYQEVLYDL